MTSQNGNHPLPNSLPAERAILGAVLLGMEGAAKELIGEVSESDFYSSRNRAIFKVISDLQESGKPIDLLIVNSELERRGDLDEVGGTGYLASLIDGAWYGAHRGFYARIVREKAILRNLAKEHYGLYEACLEQDLDFAEILARATDAMETASRGLQRETATGFVDLKTIGREIIDKIESGEKPIPANRILTEIRRLDDMTMGLQPGEMFIIAGRPSVGKSAFLVQLAAEIGVRKRLNVGMVSLEGKAHDLQIRIACNLGRIDSHRMRAGRLSREEKQKAFIALGDSIGGNVHLAQPSVQSIEEVRAWALRMREQNKLDLFMLDYIQLLTSKLSYGSRQEEVAHYSHELHRLGVEMNIPVVVASQLRREVDSQSRQAPRLSDLKESGAIEQDADTVAILHRPFKRKDEDKSIQLRIAKQRNGPTGTIHLVFLNECGRFEEMA